MPYCGSEWVRERESGFGRESDVCTDKTLEGTEAKRRRKRERLNSRHADANVSIQSTGVEANSLAMASDEQPADSQTNSRNGLGVQPAKVSQQSHSADDGIPLARPQPVTAADCSACSSLC